MSGMTEDIEQYTLMCAHFEVPIQFARHSDGEIPDVYGHGRELWDRFQRERADRRASMNEDDRLREPMLRQLLRQPVVHGEIREGDGHEAYHVSLIASRADLFACAVFATKWLDPKTAKTGFTWRAVDENWPDLDVDKAIAKWCKWNFTDQVVPKFNLVRK